MAADKKNFYFHFHQLISEENFFADEGGAKAFASSSFSSNNFFNKKFSLWKFQRSRCRRRRRRRRRRSTFSRQKTSMLQNYHLDWGFLFYIPFFALQVPFNYAALHIINWLQFAV